MSLLPIFASLSQRTVLVVGVGAVAECRIATWLGVQAQVTGRGPKASGVSDHGGLLESNHRLAC